MSYSVQNIRNVCLLGHSGSGKTSLAENLLFMTGAIERQGRVADGNTVCDYDPEEVKRQISLSTAVAPIDYKGCRINVLDTPGAFDFSGEVMEALRAADAAIIVCSAKDGVSVGMEKAWKYCEERNMPRFVYISKTDEDNSDYNATFDALRERFGKNIAPVVVPIWDENKKVTGIIDVLNKRAYEMQGGKRVEIEVPEDKVSVIEEFNDALKESVAETSEEFMERFFNGEAFTYAEMAQGLREGVRELSIFPVLCGSAVAGMGTLMLLDNIVELLPSPEQREYMYHQIRELRGKKPIFMLDFQNDGEYVGGCIAGGRRYLHINANGDCDPCVFIHYSDSNIRQKTLLEALCSPLFRAYHDGQPFNDNMLRPCPMLENPEKLREIVHKSSAHPSDVTALESVDDLCAKCDDYAKNWAPTADKLWSCSHHCGTCGQQAAAEK